MHPSSSAKFTPRRFLIITANVSREGGSVRVLKRLASPIIVESNGRFISNRSDVTSGAGVKIINRLGKGESPRSTYFYIPPRKCIPFLLDSGNTRPRNSNDTRSQLRISGRRWRTRAEFPPGRVRSAARGWFVHRYRGKPVDRAWIDLRSRSTFRFRVRGRSAIFNADQAVLGKRASPTQGGRRTHCCVAAGLLTVPSKLSARLGASRAGPSPSGAAAA